MKSRFLTLALAAALCSAVAARAADEANSPEARLRDALRSTMLQLRTVTADRDNLQAQETDMESQKKQLADQLAALTKQSAAAHDADTKVINELKARVSDQEGSIAELQKSLQVWEDSQKKAVAMLNETEARRAKLSDQAIKLQRVVEDQKTKNDAMYKIGMEVLDRYEKFGLGQALFAKEPFVGITRTKLETLVQDYEDKLANQQIKQ